MHLINKVKVGGANIIRYLVFAWDDCVFEPGMEQIKGRFSSKDDAIRKAKEEFRVYDYSTVYDVETGENLEFYCGLYIT